MYDWKLPQVLDSLFLLLLLYHHPLNIQKIYV